MQAAAVRWSVEAPTAIRSCECVCRVGAEGSPLTLLLTLVGSIGRGHFSVGFLLGRLCAHRAGRTPMPDAGKVVWSRPALSST